jgi:hypothetical protein
MIENRQHFPGVSLIGPGDPDRVDDVDSGEVVLRLQVLDIIRRLLEDRRPETAAARARMRRQLALHPGYPELALRAHLQERYAA